MNWKSLWELSEAHTGRSCCLGFPRVGKEPKEVLWVSILCSRFLVRHFIFLNSPFNKLFFYSYSISKQKLSRFSKIKTQVSGRCECTWIQDTLNSWVMLSLPWGLWASGWNLTQSSVLGRGRLVNYPGVSHIPGLINQKWKQPTF